MGDLRLEASCLIDISSHEVELEWRPETLGMRIIVMKIENNKQFSPVEQFYIRCCVLSQFIHGSRKPGLLMRLATFAKTAYSRETL